jgi:hypothetical protein
LALTLPIGLHNNNLLSEGYLMNLIYKSSLVSTLLLMVSQAYAVPFDAIRIGDVDGFGYGGGSGWVGWDGTAVNRDGGLLSTGDLLPDVSQTLNQSAADDGVFTGGRDDFDFRSASEISGNYTTGAGYTDTGSSGSQYTDISLSTSYDSSSAGGDVLIDPNSATATKGAGGLFPAPPSGTLTNQPGFVFDFFVADTDIVAGTDIFLNLVFGDYDVAPAQVQITNGSIQTVPLTLQQNFGDDGLIQAAFVTLDFDTVFTAVAGGFDGHLLVDFLAPAEPYTAFDFVELSVEPININPVPEPGILALVGLGLAGFGFTRKKRRV